MLASEGVAGEGVSSHNGLALTVNNGGGFSRFQQRDDGAEPEHIDVPKLIQLFCKLLDQFGMMGGGDVAQSVSKGEPALCRSIGPSVAHLVAPLRRVRDRLP